MAPPREVISDRANASLPMLTESVAVQAELLRGLLFTVDRAEERAALGGEDGLGVLGVAELSPAVRVIRCSG